MYFKCLIAMLYNTKGIEMLDKIYSINFKEN